MLNHINNWYLEKTAHGELTVDNNQLELIKILDTLLTNFNNKNPFNIFKKKPFIGLYVYSPPGRGKTMLINKFFENLHIKTLRMHFHEFIKNINDELALLQNHKNPIQKLAKNLKKKYSIIIIDELHINDIANAILFKNLLEHLIKLNLSIIISSNYAPNDLYKDGLMKEHFSKAINLIKKHFIIFCLESNYDYRKVLINEDNHFIFNANFNKKQTEYLLNDIFSKINNSFPVETKQTILIQNRKIDFIKKGVNIIWFRFDVICGFNRSQLDYIELSNKFTYIIISELYTLNNNDTDLIRRFTLLIDILYDKHIKLILSLNCKDLSSIINTTSNNNSYIFREFDRIISRLSEMQIWDLNLK